MYSLIIVTDKANHGLSYFDEKKCHAELKRIEEAWNVYLGLCNSGDTRGRLFRATDDSFGAGVLLDLSHLVTVQLVDAKGEGNLRNEREKFAMYADLDKGEMMLGDGRLKDAQARAAARSKLAVPGH